MGPSYVRDGMNPFSAILFSVPTLIITIPATVATLMWLGSIYGANLRFTASLFCLGFIYVWHQRRNQRLFLAQRADINLTCTPPTSSSRISIS